MASSSRSQINSTEPKLDIYEQKDEAYFGYYSMLSHQAQMLQDTVRTSAYQRAILENLSDFRDKVVMDVGAGNGILSFFAAQAGAKKVYAVEASNMVDCLKQVVRASKRGVHDKFSNSRSVAEEEHEVKEEQAVLEMMGANASSAGIGSSGLFGTTSPPEARNAWLQDRLVPVHSKVEDVTSTHLDGHTQVDTIVSECLGVLLVHERMCESFLDARDRFLAPGGSVFPSAGTICLAPFEDKQLWSDTLSKARWWLNSNFYGVDISPFAAMAFKESFSSPVVGVFGPQCLLSVSSDYVIDFAKIKKEELRNFTIPVEWSFTQPAIVHGLGGWFDLHFNSQSSTTRSTDQLKTNGTSANSDEDALMADGSRAAGANGHASTSTSTPQPSSSTDPTSIASTLEQLKQASSASVGANGSSNSSTEAIINAALTGLPTVDPTNASSTRSNFMTTSPYAEPTHWQQVRFLLPEPLAVNKGQKLTGSIECQVNDQRSYTMTGHFQVLNPDGSAHSVLSRQAVWRLDRQTYSWS